MKYFIVLIVFCVSCTYNEILPNEECLTENPSFIACIKPIIDNNCVSCHNSNSLYGDLSSYSAIKDYTDSGQLINRIQRNQGDQGFMPLGGNKLTDNEIELIIKWKNDGTPNN